MTKTLPAMDRPHCMSWRPAWFLNSAFPQIPQFWSPPASSSLCHLCKSNITYPLGQQILPPSWTAPGSCQCAPSGAKPCGAVWGHTHHRDGREGVHVGPCSTYHISGSHEKITQTDTSLGTQIKFIKAPDDQSKLLSTPRSWPDIVVMPCKAMSGCFCQNVALWPHPILLFMFSYDISNS